jgi:predicted neuraminidase
VLHVQDGMVYLWFKVGKPIPIWRTYVMTSDDQGNTWSTARELVPGDVGGRGPVKNKLIVLSSGAWLAPASIEVGATPSLETGEAKNAAWNAFVDRSEDQGVTWQRSELVPYDHANNKGEGVIQPTLWESDPGKIHMLIRSGDGWINRSDSDDDGRSWCPAYRTTLPNNNSGIDLTRLADGTLALVYNPVGGNWGGRSPLTLALSYDNGKTWPHQLDLETIQGEFSYPAIITIPGGMAVTYTHDRKTIAYWQGTVEHILKA